MTDHDDPIARHLLHRRMSRRRFLQAAGTGVGAGMLAPILAACSSNSPSSTASSTGGAGAPARGGTLTFARTADPSSLDPSPVFDNEAIWTVLMMYDCLYTVTEDGQGSQPWLVQAHDLSSDKLTWTFTLKPGITFSNGQPLRSADVQFSLERAAKGDNGYILAAVDAIDAPDASTIRIHTKHPWGPLLGDLSLYSNGILPKDFAGAGEEEFFKQPIGTGPFMVDHWTKGQELALVRNPHYWQEGKPYLDGITITTVPDDNTRVLQLRGGQADVIEFPPFSAVTSLGQTSDLGVTLFPSTWVSYISMNQQKPQFADVHVRRAISYGVDTDSIIKSVLFGHGEPANSFFSPSWGFYDKSTPYYGYDPTKAKGELAQSSYPDGFPADLMVVAGDSVNGAIAQIVQANLKDLGIDISIRSYDNSAFEAQLHKGEYDMAPNYYTLDIGDPDENAPWCVDPVRGGTHSLYTWYRNEDVMKWGVEAEQTVDEQERADLYAKIQQQVASDAPFVELYYAPYIYAYRSTVQDFTVYPTGNYHLEEAWLSS
jgi:peptide/nickel transport system substrate-binding protein